MLGLPTTDDDVKNKYCWPAAMQHKHGKNQQQQQQRSFGPLEHLLCDLFNIFQFGPR